MYNMYNIIYIGNIKSIILLFHVQYYENKEINSK